MLIHSHQAGPRFRLSRFSRGENGPRAVLTQLLWAGTRRPGGRGQICKQGCVSSGELLHLSEPGGGLVRIGGGWKSRSLAQLSAMYPMTSLKCGACSGLLIWAAQPCSLGFSGQDGAAFLASLSLLLLPAEACDAHVA